MKYSKILSKTIILALLAVNYSAIFSMDSSGSSDKAGAAVTTGASTGASVAGFKQEGDVFTFTKPGLNAAASSGNKLARTLESVCRFVGNSRYVVVHGVQSPSLYDFLDLQKQITLKLPVKELQKHNPTLPAEGANAMTIIELGTYNRDQLERALFDGDKEKFYNAHKGEIDATAQKAKGEKSTQYKKQQLIAELNSIPAQMANLRAQIVALTVRENQLRDLLK